MLDDDDDININKNIYFFQKKCIKDADRQKTSLDNTQ